MKTTWGPVSAGVMQLAASIPYLFLSLGLYIFPEFLPEEYGGTRLWPPVGLVIWFPFAAPLLIGGISALIRRAWVLALVGGLMPLALTVFLSPWQGTELSMALFFSSSLAWNACRVIENIAYLFMIVSAVVAVLTRQQFVGRRSVAEQLYSPPRWYRG